jgi:hypothetical protein
MKGFLKSSYDWGIYEIKNQEVISSEDKIIVERFIRTQLLKDLDIPVAFF